MSIEIRPARTDELAEIAALVNSAFRGESSKAGWNTEEHLLGGQRTDAEILQSQLSEDAVILTLRLSLDGPIDGCVYLKRKPNGDCYLGMLTIRPTAQASGLGRTLLEYAEQFAREWKCRRIVMTVISVRDTLIAWYERRGYALTGQREEFPYGDLNFGEPKVEGLFFVVMARAL